MCSCGKPCAAKAIVVNGTWMPPPPMPSMPAKKPMKAPIATYTSNQWSTRSSPSSPPREYGRCSPVGAREAVSRTAALVSRIAGCPPSGQGMPSARRAPVGARWPPGDPLEHVRQMRCVGEAQRRGDGLELLVGGAEESLGVGHADRGEIVAAAHADLGAEEVG